jgi:general secretion pathway protein B
MSYILEALKKLEQKRQQEETPNLLTLQNRITQAPRKRSLWPYAIGGIILLNIAAALIMLRIVLWRPAERHPAVQAPPASADISSLPAAVTVAKRQDEEAAAATGGTRKLNRPAPPLTGKQIPQTVPVKPALALPSLPYKAIPDLSPPAKPPRQKGDAMNMQELPDSIRNSLPELKMTVHSYDESPQARFAIINNKMIKEGQLLVPELKLEQITPNGAILNYNSHRFLLGIN